MNLDVEDKSSSFSWWMQNVQLTSDRCHVSSNPNSDSFAGSALTSTAVLCAQAWHPSGVSPVAKGAQECPSFPSSLWWFLTPQTQCQISNSYQSSSPRASWTTQATLSPTSTSQEHSLTPLDAMALCCVCWLCFHYSTDWQSRAAKSLSWIGHAAVQWEIWTSLPCWAEREN